MKGRILIAGTNSGCGKTTVTLAVLSALKRRGFDISSFKCGPDYIDPMFHRKAVGVPSQNLDPYFCTGTQLRSQLASPKGLTVVEGVMGYYDGIGTGGNASTYDVALQTDTPVILVVNAKGMYTSAGAILKGFQLFRPNSGIRGVIFNGISPMVYNGLRQIALDAGVEPLGFLPNMPELAIASRHLGLVTADEIGDIHSKLNRLGEEAERSIDLDGLLALAQSAQPLVAQPIPSPAPLKVRIAVARDEAFCFLYEENLTLLRDLGCELCWFSPLRDRVLPHDISGLYLPGGYPELHKQQLSQNTAMLHTIKDAITQGLPTIAECGGFLYLHHDVDGIPMAGVIPASAKRTDRLQHFGYIQLTAQQDNLLCNCGASIRAHEFHYYDSSDYGCGFLAEKPSGTRKYPCVHTTPTLYAGFPHLYFPANPEFAQHFVRKAAEYGAADHS